MSSRKIAFITGASRGLGRSMALHLAARGIDVPGTFDSDADEAEAVARGRRRHAEARYRRQ